jgi:hypothetical protein
MSTRWATNCASAQGSDVGDRDHDQYMYRVAALRDALYKTCEPAAADMICLSSSRSSDRCRATVMFILDDEAARPASSPSSSLSSCRTGSSSRTSGPAPAFGPRAEIPTRADASSIAYRRWLKEKGITYGTAERAA